MSALRDADEQAVDDGELRDPADHRPGAESRLASTSQQGVITALGDG